jgi:hypothetical protein
MDETILQKPIPELPLSNSFKEMAHRHDFRTLQDILAWPASVLLMHEDFTQHHFQELRNFLIKENGLNLLKTSKS